MEPENVLENQKSGNNLRKFDFTLTREGRPGWAGVQFSAESQVLCIQDQQLHVNLQGNSNIWRQLYNRDQAPCTTQS